MDKKEILVTGAKGYIGSNFIKKYSNKYLLNIVSLSSGDNPDLSKTTTVLHLSALVHQAKVLPDKHYFDINTIQTVKLAKKAKKYGVKHFIFYSTTGVYGAHGYFGKQTNILNEISNCHPSDAYGKSKLLAEKEIFSLEDNQFKVTAIRPPIVYGEDCPGNIKKLRNLIKLFPILPFDYTNNKRSMIKIENLLFFTELVIDKQVTGILIPQDKNQYSIKQIIEMISNNLNKKVFLFKFPKPLLFLLKKTKLATAQSLYGTLVFDSNKTNKKTKFNPKC
jgi:UDP-glucose 4-epimerase